jgi:hypothetical protein
VIDIHSAFSQHLLQLTVTDAVFAVPAYGPQNDVTLKMPAFEWVHVQLHQQGDDKFITTDYLQQCPETALLLTGTGRFHTQCLDPVPAVTQHKVRASRIVLFGLIVPDQNVTVMSEAQVQFRNFLKFCSITA